MLKPEDIDFPVSETYRMGLSELHGWGYQGIDDYRTERERRFDDDLAETRRCKAARPSAIIPEKEDKASPPPQRRTIGPHKPHGDRPVRGL